jgi:Tol biopolymer transport system component
MDKGDVPFIANWGQQSAPRWSPDGSKIAFVAYTAGTSFTDVYVINSDGSGRRVITRADSNNSSPAWSVDGKQIAFEKEHFLGHDTDLYLINSDGTNERPAVTLDWSEITPVWIP